MKDVAEVTFQEAQDAIRWAKSVVKGGYQSGSDNNPKRKHMKTLYRLAKLGVQTIRDDHLIGDDE